MQAAQAEDICLAVGSRCMHCSLLTMIHLPGVLSASNLLTATSLDHPRLTICTTLECLLEILAGA